MKAQEICLGVVILTPHVHNHNIIIATELQMADRWDESYVDERK